MKKVKDIELIKDLIIKELFIDINNQCIIDIYLNDNKSNLLRNYSISNISMNFLESERDKLLSEYGKGQILFFRKYSYEKILNDYLARLYNVEFTEMNMFPSADKVKELEKIRLEYEKERDIINHISDYSWVKTVKINRIIYKAELDGKIIELQLITNTPKDKSVVRSHILKYGKKNLAIEYNGDELVQKIEKTHPKRNATESIIVVTSPQNSRQNKKQVAQVKDKSNVNNTQKTELIETNQRHLLDLAKEYDLKIDRIKNLVGFYQNRCKYYRGGKYCSYFNKLCSISPKCVCYNEFIKKIREESKKGKANIKPRAVAKVIPPKVSPLMTSYVKGMTKEEELPQIGLKDFVVRGNVFACMHSGHKIDDINAIINIIDSDDKKQSVRIAAGYCKQCKIYFIMDSTYQKIKNKGIILCRVTDEKTYLKNGFTNGMQLAQESILMQYGYNVSQTEGLSATRRQKILAVIIDNKIMSKSEIISYLDFFISQRSSRSNMEIAISKWETDREFVENYKMGEYTQFGVKAIYRI